MRPSQVGLRRQSKSPSSPTVPSRAKARARTAEPTKTIEPPMASARKRVRNGSPIAPPRSAVRASPGIPIASRRVTVPSASGSRAWAKPRSIARAATQPPGWAASAGPRPSPRRLLTPGAASQPARPAPTTRASAALGQRSPRRGPSVWAITVPAATTATSPGTPRTGSRCAISWTRPPTTAIHAPSATITRTSGARLAIASRRRLDG